MHLYINFRVVLHEFCFFRAFEFVSFVKNLTCDLFLYEINLKRILPNAEQDRTPPSNTVNYQNSNNQDQLPKRPPIFITVSLVTSWFIR